MPRPPLEPPPPDRKDWTWTLDRRCPECGLAAGEVPIEEVADRAEAAAAEWVQILTSNPAAAARPAPAVWSPLEYGAHVRDVYAVFDERLGSMLDQDDPVFADWDQDATAVSDDYAGQDPDVVAEELFAAAGSLVSRLRGLRPEQLDRPGRRSEGSRFTVTTLAQYFLHDVLHHLWDVTGQPARP
ncbi:hypothetical protein FHX74_000916 [Friedmanniella endophytica]|uniref:DinB-like domain-containing protein n=1 Tax=Microlunatus kandeliicorticis TaxID=1759536 RepID=A0A7W3IQE2_9ACTN|nr:DinB family protein [Microlunatus kandeliicorticis]MBA8793322.1 hypothetical protein [Microlunatus kandeliicorticis]